MKDADPASDRIAGGIRRERSPIESVPRFDFLHDSLRDAGEASITKGQAQLTSGTLAPFTSTSFFGMELS